MSGPSSLRVAFDFCAASRRACRSALPIAGSSRSMIYLRMIVLPFSPADGGRSGGAGKARHHFFREEPHRGLRRSERHHVEVDLQRSVLEAAELLPTPLDRGDDLVRRADPGGTAGDLV